jgi:antitoxin PrlF
MLSTVTTKGQVTIPKQIREALNISPNDKVDFVQEGEKIVMIPLKPLQSFRGAVKASRSLTFEDERAKAKKGVARRLAEEVK